MCLTQQNVSAPWLLFEAGALSKAVGFGRVLPYLIDLRPTDLTGPLSQFQAARANRAGTLRIYKEIEAACGSTHNYRELFEREWPRMARALYWREIQVPGG
jgi:hypothetical protein